MKTRPLPRIARLLALTLTLSLTTYLAARANTFPVAVGDTTAVGIRFFTGSWSQLLAEAKKQNKPVFVDVFTTWCGPCKLMAKQAFPDKAVGTLFNANFISYQIDAEKGEGLDVAKKYAVTAYPTSLFVSADGNLIQRTVGYGGIKGLMDEASKAVDAAKDPKPMSVWDEEFANGKRDAAFLSSYLAKRAKLGMPSAEALEAYLNVAPETEWTKPANIDAVAANLTTANSRAFGALLGELKTMMTDKARMASVQNMMQAVGMAVSKDERKAKTEAELEQAVANVVKMRNVTSPKPITADQQASIANTARMGFYKRTKNVPKYRETAVKSGNDMMAISTDSLKARDAASYQRFMDEARMVPDSMKASPNFVKYATMMKTIETQQVANGLNSLAWTFFETMPDAADLNQALAWSGRSLELTRSAMFLDTYAQLLGKLGRKDEAIKHEEEALALAKAADEDTANYVKTIADLKK